MIPKARGLVQHPWADLHRRHGLNRRVLVRIWNVWLDGGARWVRGCWELPWAQRQREDRERGMCQ